MSNLLKYMNKIIAAIRENDSEIVPEINGPLRDMEMTSFSTDDDCGSFTLTACREHHTEDFSLESTYIGSFEIIEGDVSITSLEEIC